VYEGDQSEPLTLHQYLYAHANPVNLLDPSGLSVVNFDRGGEINNLIGMHFITEDPENREYDRYGARWSSFLGARDGSRQLTLRYVIRRALDDYSHPGVPGFNRLKPDLADFGTFELYEIKSSNDLAIGLGELAGYLSLLNMIPEMPKHWYAGNNFVPPAIISTSTGDLVWVHPPIFGVVTYDIISDWRDAALATSALLTVSAIQELIAQVLLTASLQRF
jgi:hypothetical protein